MQKGIQDTSGALSGLTARSKQTAYDKKAFFGEKTEDSPDPGSGLCCIFQGEPLWSLYVAGTEHILRECSQERSKEEGMRPTILSPLHLCTLRVPKGAAALSHLLTHGLGCLNSLLPGRNRGLLRSA